MLQLLQSKTINIPPSADHSHQPGRQGRAVSIPEPPEAQTPVCSGSIFLPGIPGLAHHTVWHGQISFSRCQIPGEECQDP